jgi:uncharacterized membrane protein (UPF0182 family)
MKLPGSSTLEYLLMTPFTPDQRSNMISWMAAGCDFPDYGNELLYQLPTDKLIYRPRQLATQARDRHTFASVVSESPNNRNRPLFRSG